MNNFSSDIKHQCFSSGRVGIFKAVLFSSFYTLNLQLCNIIKRIFNSKLSIYNKWPATVYILHFTLTDTVYFRRCKFVVKLEPFQFSRDNFTQIKSKINYLSYSGPQYKHDLVLWQIIGFQNTRSQINICSVWRKHTSEVLLSWSVVNSNSFRPQSGKSW